MRVLFTPIRADFDVSYTLEPEKVTFRINNQQPVTRDLASYGEGEYIPTEMPVQQAIRKGGVLYVTLVRPHGYPVPEWAIQEPQWEEV